MLTFVSCGTLEKSFISLNNHDYYTAFNGFNNGLKKENKIIAHVAVLITFIALIGLIMPLNAAIKDDRLLSLIRVLGMMLTGSIAMIVFIKSFIQARKNK